MSKTKSFFKKCLSFIMALMLFVTSFTITGFVPNVETQAAETTDATAELTEKMKEFEDMLQTGNIYTNISNAYSAYVEASKAYDSYYYGGDTSIDLATKAENLNNAVNSMKPWTQPNIDYVQPSLNNTVDNGFYGNVLYYNNNGTNGISDMNSYVVFNGNNRDLFRVKFHINNNIVLIYDGNNDVRFPITIEGTKIKSGNRKYSNAKIACIYFKENENNKWKLDKQWIGKTSTWNAWPQNGSASFGYIRTWEQGTFTWDNETYIFGNGIKYNGTGNSVNYFEKFDSSNKITLTVYANGGYGDSDHWVDNEFDMSPFDNGHAFSETAVYVLDYSSVIEKIKSTAKSFSSENVNNYKGNGLNTFINALNELQNYNPNAAKTNVSNAKDVANNYSSTVKTLISNIDNAKKTKDDPNQYPALRTAMDNAMATYKAGRGNYTYRSYNQFKTAYEFAQTVMQNVSQWGYIDGSFAQTAAEKLTVAYNNLETPKANITFDNLFSFEDFYNSASAQQGSLSSATFDRANKSMTLTGTGDVATVYYKTDLNDLNDLYMIPVEAGKTYRLELDVEADNNFSLTYCDVMAFLPNKEGTSYDGKYIDWRGFNAPTTWQNTNTHKSIEFTIPADYPTDRCKIFFRFGTCPPQGNEQEITATFKNIAFYDVERENERVAGIQEKSVTPGQAYGTLPDSPTREGYNFLGWYTTEGTQVTAETVPTVAGTINLQSKWEIKTFKVQVNGVDFKTVNYGTAFEDLGITIPEDFCRWTNKPDKITADTNITYDVHNYIANESTNRFVCSICNDIKKDGGQEIDLEAYYSNVALANSDLKNTAKYTEASLNALQQAINDNQLAPATDIQSTVDAKADAIGSAITNLKRKDFTVIFKYQLDGDDVAKEINTIPCKYGDVLNLSAPENSIPYKWIYSIEGVGDTQFANASTNASVVVNDNMIVTVCLAKDEAQTEESTTVRVNLYDKSKRLIGIAYTTGLTITFTDTEVRAGSKTLTPTRIPFYNAKGFIVDGTIYSSSNQTYTIPDGKKIVNIYTNYVVESKIKISVPADVTLNGNTVSTDYYEATWNEMITLTSDSEVDWYANGVLVGKGTAYAFRANADVEITTQTAQQNVTPSTSIGYFAYDKELNRVSLVNNFYAPNASEAGVILSTKYSSVEDVKKYGQKFGVTNENFTKDKNQVRISVSRKASTSFTMYAVSYVVAEDGQTYYSNVVSVCNYVGQ